MVISSASCKFDVDVSLMNVDDVDGLKMGDPWVQVGQFGPDNHKSEDPVSRET
jgi:hypothetical protein